MSTLGKAKADKSIWVFFYGSFMDEDKLRSLGVRPRRSQPARLNDFQIRFQPLANLKPLVGYLVYGLLTQLSQMELDHLYQGLESNSASRYLPIQVDVMPGGQPRQSALCYLAEQSADQAPQAEYLNEIIRAARNLGFLAHYINTLRSFGNTDQ